MRKFFICFVSVLLIGSLIVMRPVKADCTGEADCYDVTPTPDSQASPSGWPPDDRLNPVPDEYYTVYCHFDQIEVWRAAGGSMQLAAIPISRVMTAVRPFDSSGLQVSRSDNVVTISGANGNGPNHPGSKSFTLDECFARNGGIPDLPASANSAPDSSVTPRIEACTYYFGDIPDGTDTRSHAPSIVGIGGECQPPAVGAECTFNFIVDVSSSGDRSWTQPMPGTISSNGECEPNPNPALLMLGILRAFANAICMGVAGLPLGGMGLWLRKQRRLSSSA